MGLYELFVGLRYLKSKKVQGFISFNTILSVLIVFLGVFILIIVISVMNGFQAQIKDKILDVDAHITVMNYYGSSKGDTIWEYREIVKKLKTIKGVVTTDPYIHGQGLIRYKNNISYVMLRGIGTKGGMPAFVKKFITDGEKEFTEKSGIYIGAEMARNFGIKMNDVIEIIVPKGRLTATTGVLPGIGSYHVTGFFKTGYYDFDTKLIMMSLPQAQELFSVGDIAWGVGVKIDDVYKMDTMASKITSAIGFEYVTMTAEEKNQNLFYALKLEKLIMIIILFLVIISAGFTIMGTLVMVVMEKRKSIGILKSMGARPRSIMIIFVLEGFLIGVIGTLLGVLFGLAAAINLEAIIKWLEKSINAFGQQAYDFLKLGIFEKISIVPTNIYYIDSIPTEVKPEFVVFISIFAVFLSTVAAIFPAWSASRLNPVETIRYD